MFAYQTTLARLELTINENTTESDAAVETVDESTDDEITNAEPLPSKLEFTDLAEYQKKNLIDVFGDDVAHSPDAEAPISVTVDTLMKDAAGYVDEIIHLANAYSERIQSVRSNKKIEAVELYDLFILGDYVRSASSDAVNGFKDAAAKIGNTRSIRTVRTRTRSW